MDSGMGKVDVIPKIVTHLNLSIHGTSKQILRGISACHMHCELSPMNMNLEGKVMDRKPVYGRGCAQL